MNHTAIRNAIYAWARDNSSGAPVVWSDQAAPRPAKPYVTLKISGPFRDMGQDEMRQTGPNTFSVFGPRRLVLNVQVFGVTEIATHTLAERLNFSLSMEGVRQAFSAATLAISDPGDLTNITTFVDTTWEPRFSFDVVLLTVATGEETLSTIEMVELNSRNIG